MRPSAEDDACREPTFLSSRSWTVPGGPYPWLRLIFEAPEMDWFHSAYSLRRDHSFRANSGPVILFRSGNVEAMIASDAASPPRMVAQYAIPGNRNAMPAWEWR